MLAVKGYFDGRNYITEGNVAVKPNQRVIITFLDDDIEGSPQNTAQKMPDETCNRYAGDMARDVTNSARATIWEQIKYDSW